LQVLALRSLVVSILISLFFISPALAAEQHAHSSFDNPPYVHSAHCKKEVLENGLEMYLSEAIYEHPLPKMAPTISGPAALSLPAYHSNPDAHQKIYLNFKGCFTPKWGNPWDDFNDLVTPPFDDDGDYATFNASELAKIEEVWKRVSEDYAPFDIDVTTEKPYSFQNGQSLEVCIGGRSSDWLDRSVGGTAMLNSYSNSSVNVVFVFAENLGRRAKSMAEAASHEIGHAFGLYHQSEWEDDEKVREYYRGFGSGDTGWAPIMGSSYSKTWSTFANSRNSAGKYQNDVDVITRSKNQITYRPDDHGSTNATATNLTPDNDYRIASNGLIEQMSDVDVFEFYTAAGDITLTVDNFEVGPNLNVKIELRDISNNIIATGDPEDSLDASISANVAAGRYFLHVMTGATTIQISVGQYIVDGTLIAPGEASESTLVSAVNVTQPGTTYRDIEVHLTDSDSLNISSIGTGDVIVTGPNGFSQVASFQSIISTSNRSSMTAIYRVSSAWDKIDNGVYDINLAANQVYDNLGNPFPADYLGSFSVELRLVPPASISAEVDVSLSHVDITWGTVSEATGYSIYRSTLFGSNGSNIADVANVTTYRDTSAQAGISYYYSVKAKNAFGAGEASSQVLGRRAADLSPSVATLIFTQDITADGHADSEIRVRYADGDLVNGSSIGAGDLLILGPNSFVQVATFVSSDTSNPTSMVGYYKVLAPNTTWSGADNGTYQIYLRANQVTDSVSNTFASRSLGTFFVSLAPPQSPVQISAGVDMSMDHIDVSWAAVTGLQDTRYIVQQVLLTLEVLLQISEQ
jgi:hypothetical protein